VHDPLQAIDGWPCGRAAALARTPAGTWSHGATDEPFPLASVTKLLTATAVLVAAEEEIVALDDEIADGGATLADLLAHSSGISPDDVSWFVTTPRTRRVYSNAGYVLAGRLVEEASGMPFAAYLDEAVCRPLGMHATELRGSPAADGVSTADDLFRFAAAMADGTGPLAAETVRRMTRPHLPGLAGVLPGHGRQSDNQWGLGPELRDGKSPHWTGTGNSPSTWGHFGRSGTFLWVDPERSALLVCLTDRDFGPWAADRWPALADAVLAT
jgi:CubicO group peptidase (beta-lactamase class C family)